MKENRPSHLEIIDLLERQQQKLGYVMEREAESQEANGLSVILEDIVDSIDESVEMIKAMKGDSLQLKA